jgi:hypothetical protein
MAGSSLVDKSKPPDEASLAAALGQAKRLWDAIVARLDERGDAVEREWKFYGAKHGWQLKATYRKRAALYLIPKPGGFLAALALNEQAVAAARASDLPPAIIREIENAKTYAEGRPVRIEVTGPAQVEIVQRLLAIKLASVE